MSAAFTSAPHWRGHKLILLPKQTRANLEALTVLYSSPPPPASFGLLGLGQARGAWANSLPLSEAGPPSAHICLPNQKLANACLYFLVLEKELLALFL